MKDEYVDDRARFFKGLDVPLWNKESNFYPDTSFPSRYERIRR